MNKKNYVLTALAVSFLTSATLISCKKDSNNNNSQNASDIEVTENNNLAEASYDDVTTVVDEAAISGSANLRTSTSESSLTSSCATVSFDSTANGHTITINFGTANCLCYDGRYRRGKIVATWTGRYRDSATVISVSFDGYAVNDNVIKGTKKVTNQGHNAAGHLVYKVEVQGQIVKANNAGTVSWASTRQREWLTGENTISWDDDSYGITGDANGNIISGATYNIHISQQLVRALNCRWFQSGVISFTPEGSIARTIDFGNTGCDNKATLIIANVSIPVILQ